MRKGRGVFAWRTSEAELAGKSRRAAEQRLSDRGREHVVEIKVQLPENADAGAAGAVHRHLRFETDLEVATDPDHARIDRAGGDEAVAEIIGDRRCELCFDDRNQMIDDIGEL